MQYIMVQYISYPVSDRYRTEAVSLTARGLS